MACYFLSTQGALLSSLWMCAKSPNISNVSYLCLSSFFVPPVLPYMEIIVLNRYGSQVSGIPGECNWTITLPLSTVALAYSSK